MEPDEIAGEKLLTVRRGEDYSIYRIEGRFAPHVKRFVVSTHPVRDVLNRPEIVGFQFTDALKFSVSRTLTNFPEPAALEGVTDLHCNVFSFLRGGLNFGIGEALHEALGFNLISSSFMTSQRDRDPEGRWFIKDDQYQKFTFTRDATVFCGDIVATGSTIENGLMRLLKIAKNSGKPIRNLIFFTVGCHKIEKILEKYHLLFAENFKRYSSTILFYLEGKFKLANSDTDLKIKIQGTDLLKYPALIAPEYELSFYDQVSSVLERCVIYDGGTRKFEVEEYYDDVLKYWLAVRRQAIAGLTLGEAASERWPEKGYDLPMTEFILSKRMVWPDVPDKLLQKIYQARQNRWTGRFRHQATSSEALVRLCDERLNALIPKPSKFSGR